MARATWRDSGKVILYPCAWDDDGFAKYPCGQHEDDHCDIKGQDDSCPMVHHPYQRRSRKPVLPPSMHSDQEENNDG